MNLTNFFNKEFVYDIEEYPSHAPVNKAIQQYCTRRMYATLTGVKQQFDRQSERHGSILYFKRIDDSFDFARMSVDKSVDYFDKVPFSTFVNAFILFHVKCQGDLDSSNNNELITLLSEEYNDNYDFYTETIFKYKKVISNER